MQGGYINAEFLKSTSSSFIHSQLFHQDPRFEKLRAKYRSIFKLYISYGARWSCYGVNSAMVNMETPKCRKLRRVKGSSKKKKIRPTDEVREPRFEKSEHAGTSTDTTPPRTSKSSTIVERGQEEVRGVEWQYHRKFVESDIPVVWGSPHGSPVVNTVQTVCGSPVQKPKRRTANCTPRKLNSEECEPPQFLNEILALSEKIKAEEKNNEQPQNDHVNEEMEEKAPKNALDESYSNFFDEDMNECMLQCSQELEQTSSESIEVPILSNAGIKSGHENQENKKTAVKSEPLRSSPRKKISGGVAPRSLNTTSGVFHLKNNVNELEAKSSRVANKNYVHSNRKVNTYIFQGRVLGSRGNMETLNVNTSESGQGKINNSWQGKRSSVDSKLQTSGHKLDRISKSNRLCYTSLDNSFETVKESFLDDDIEFLSKIPDDLEMVSGIENKESAQTKPLNTLDLKQQNYNQLQSTSSVLEDSTYFEEGVLQYLDTLECNVTPSQPLKCTPEEIEKKRQEAKLKLQKKTLSKK